MFKLLPIVFLILYTPATIPKDSGTYNVDISYEDKNGITLDTVMKTTVTSENTKRYENILLDANDFYITDKDNITDELILDKSNVKIWNENTFEEYAVSKIDYKEMTKNEYSVTMYYNDVTSITINMYVVGENEYNEIVFPVSYEKYGKVYKDNSNNAISKFSNIKFISLGVPIIIYFLTFIFAVSQSKLSSSVNKNLQSYLNYKNLTNKK
ncbi:MAG: hypothetical protein ACK5NF_02215 [Bacilli bacterium]